MGFIKLKGRGKHVKNCQRYHIEHIGQLPVDPDKLRELQADVRRLPGFEGRGVCCNNIITRDFYAILKDKVTGEILPYYGSRDSFNAWGQQEWQEPLIEVFKGMDPESADGLPKGYEPVKPLVKPN